MDACRQVRCNNKAYLKGLCKKHYDALRTAGRTCSVEGCNRAEYALGLCRHHRRPDCAAEGCSVKADKVGGYCAHHLRLLDRYGSVDARICAVKSCHEALPKSGTSDYCGRHQKRRKLAVHGDQACDKCGDVFTPHSTSQRWCYTCVPKNDKSSHARMSRYNLSRPEFDSMLAEQRGACGICGKEMSRPCVDHDHATGDVRGLLCGRCNTVLHEIEDSDWMDKARAYLGREQIES